MDMQVFFSGQELYGDNFSLEEISKWYADEKEGYADLIKERPNEYRYGYHEVNKYYGFKYLPKGKFGRTLGIGSAYGHEFIPILDQIQELYVLEPSDSLISPELRGIPVIYKKPSIDGKIDFADDFFDLIICFDTLHHIPNVSRILFEMARCLKPGGFLLFKEPIISMGNWNEPRIGLTKRERGIPLNFFRKTLKDLQLIVIKESLFFTMTSFITRKTSKVFKRPIFEHKGYLLFDNMLSRMFSWNIIYHASNKWQRIAPSEVFYVVTKQTDK
ncbi:MAG TPA: class I SAM-dependent methyltransferase [Candidatus Babeliaceae bacterium]|nr:class I SAM-dependent methyltransferase [Candidatus Babeliaceae bacterium]